MGMHDTLPDAPCWRGWVSSLKGGLRLLGVGMVVLNDPVDEVFPEFLTMIAG